MQTIQLLEKNALTDSLFHLRFSRPKHWNYQAGQFARIGLALNGGEPVLTRCRVTRLNPPLTS